MRPVEPGTLYGVGVGPGDPELMTRKAARILAEVDWIFAPAGTGGRAGFARRIVEPLGLSERKFREISLCMKRDRRSDEDAYHEAALAIAAELRQRRSVAWITEGDPLFYSTFARVLENLRRLCPEAKVEIVPGVPSTSAAAARLGVPIAQLDETVAVVPATYGLENLAGLIAEFETVFLLKVGTVIDDLLALLPRLPVRAWYLENIGTPAERVVTDLESLRGQELPYFSLVMLRRDGGQAP